MVLMNVMVFWYVMLYSTVDGLLQNIDIYLPNYMVSHLDPCLEWQRKGKKNDNLFVNDNMCPDFQTHD
jgi:hypothetical protein